MPVPGGRISEEMLPVTVSPIAFRVLLDIAFLLLVVVLECFSFTGLTWHEWIGFGLCPVAILHVVLQWDWFTSQLRTILPLRAARSANLLLNTLLLTVAVGTTVSGILISHQIVPLIGGRLGETYVWLWIHKSLNKPLLFLVGLHLALNWNWVRAVPSSRFYRKTNAADAKRVPNFAVRTASVSTIACAVAFGVYLLSMPVAQPPQQWNAAAFRPAGVTIYAPKPDALRAARSGRPFSVRRGFDELALVGGILLVSLLAGRYLFRLRL